MEEDGRDSDWSKVKRFHSDNSGEYENYLFIQYVEMRALYDTSLFEIHHNKMGW